MTSPVDTSVKFFHYQQTNAPTLNGLAGTMLTVLDACLVNGYGLKTADSLVVAGGVATFNVSSGHSAEVGCVQFIAGATPSNLNGEQKVTAVTTTSWSFATAEVNGTATGTITGKVAPAGCTKDFSGSNLGVYRGIAGLGSRAYLRVDDSIGKWTRTKGYATMSDVNTGTGQFPTDTDMSGGLFWNKSDAASVTAMPWVIVADGGFMHFIPSGYQTSYSADPSNMRFCWTFGDCPSYKSGDAYNCFINGTASDPTTPWTGIYNQNDVWVQAPDSTSSYKFLQRSYNQTTIGARASTGIAAPWLVNVNTGFGGSGMAATSFPSQTDGGILLSQVNLLEPFSYTLRGYLPGLYGTGMRFPANLFDDRTSLPGVGVLAGKTLKYLRTAVPPFSVTGICAFYDITGPWR